MSPALDIPVRQDVTYEIQDHIARITINRPERRNAISRATRRALLESFADATVNPDVWVVILTGTGDKAFCAGGDMKEMDEIAKRERKFSVPMTGTDRNLYETVLETYKPTIAALNGPAAGGGCEIALACDIRIAASHASLALPEAKRGMGANFGSVLLPRMVPHAIAMQMLYTGDPMPAEEALRWGLVNQVVPGEELAAAVDAMAARIVANAPLTLRRYKHVATKGRDLPVAAALRLDVGPNPYVSADREEGVRAFVEKRKPNWQAR
jgi:enoyl-CoA hydratase